VGRYFQENCAQSFSLHALLQQELHIFCEHEENNSRFWYIILVDITFTSFAHKYHATSSAGHKNATVFALYHEFTAAGIFGSCCHPIHALLQ
jgi:hypothetical protein